MNKVNMIIGSILLMISAAVYADDTTNRDFTAEQKNQIERIVHDYLIKNPQVLVEASDALQQQQQSGLQKRVKDAVPSQAKALFHDAMSPVLGNPKGDVTIVEFFDYQCSHCKNVSPIVGQVMKSDPQVRVIYKNLPIFGANSVLAAKAGLAAQKQGKFTAMHEALMKAENPLTSDIVFKIAKEQGLDVTALQKEIASPALEQATKANYQLAEALGVSFTPAFIIASRVDAPNSKDINIIFVPGGANQKTLEKLIATVRKDASKN